MYDKYGKEGIEGGGHASAEDIFAQFFGGSPFSSFFGGGSAVVFRSQHPFQVDEDNQEKETIWFMNLMLLWKTSTREKLLKWLLREILSVPSVKGKVQTTVISSI